MVHQLRHVGNAQPGRQVVARSGGVADLAGRAATRAACRARQLRRSLRHIVEYAAGRSRLAGDVEQWRQVADGSILLIDKRRHAGKIGRGRTAAASADQRAAGARRGVAAEAKCQASVRAGIERRRQRQIRQQAFGGRACIGGDLLRGSTLPTRPRVERALAAAAGIGRIGGADRRPGGQRRSARRSAARAVTGRAHYGVPLRGGQRIHAVAGADRSRSSRRSAGRRAAIARSGNDRNAFGRRLLIEGGVKLLMRGTQPGFASRVANSYHIGQILIDNRRQR